MNARLNQHSTDAQTLKIARYYEHANTQKHNKICSLGMPDTSLRGRRTRTARNVWNPEPEDDGSK